MNSKEMFEALGYAEGRAGNVITYHDYSRHIVIRFDLDRKCFCALYKSRFEIDGIYLKIEEFKAITKFYEERGWI